MLASARRMLRPCNVCYRMLASAHDIFTQTSSKFLLTKALLFAIIGAEKGKEIPAGKEGMLLCWDFMGIFTEGIVFLLHQ